MFHWRGSVSANVFLLRFVFYFTLDSRYNCILEFEFGFDRNVCRVFSCGAAHYMSQTTTTKFDMCVCISTMFQLLFLVCYLLFLSVSLVGSLEIILFFSLFLSHTHTHTHTVSVYLLVSFSRDLLFGLLVSLHFWFRIFRTIDIQNDTINSTSTFFRLLNFVQIKSIGKCVHEQQKRWRRKKIIRKFNYVFRVISIYRR